MKSHVEDATRRVYIKHEVSPGSDIYNGEEAVIAGIMRAGLTPTNREYSLVVIERCRSRIPRPWYARFSQYASLSQSTAREDLLSASYEIVYGEDCALVRLGDEPTVLTELNP